MKTTQDTYPKIGKTVNLDLSEITNYAVIQLAFQDRAIKSDWLPDEIQRVFAFLRGKSFEEQCDILRYYCVDDTDKKDDIKQADIQLMLNHLGLPTHYLGSKPLNLWDAYDRSNYHSLTKKATSRIQRVFAYFAKDVEEKDKYKVDSPPAMNYQSREEAESKLSSKTLQTVNIYALWIQE